MDLREIEELQLPSTADFHCHLRQGSMARYVTPRTKDGGASVLYVMPNTQPPITSVTQAIAYHKELSALAPDVLFMMTLYLHPDVTPNVIQEAVESAVVVGVKLYPAGVTTNSDSGVLDIEQYFPVFKAMEHHDLVLNLHGEAVGTSADVTPLNAEARFLPQLNRLHQAFPRLRIVLEHVSTQEGIQAVEACGPSVRGTITAHHLWATTEDAERDSSCFCKPLPKSPEDRKALLKVVVNSNGKFFFGSDSAPHVKQSKEGSNVAAGCYTGEYATQLVIGALEEALDRGWIMAKEISQQALEGFLSSYGRNFYKVSSSGLPLSGRLQNQAIVLSRIGSDTIPNSIVAEDGQLEIVPFRAGKQIRRLEWQACV